MFASEYYRGKLSNLPQVAVDAGDYRIIKSTRGFRDRLLELISTATRRIYITALYLEADSAGEEVFRALLEARKANPELDVQVFVDFHRAQRGRIGEASAQTNRDFYQRLNSEYPSPVGVHGVPVKTREVFGVLHLKGFVFDDTILYSGASINDVYLHQDQRYRYDRYHEIHSCELSNSFVAFIDNYFRNNVAVKDFNTEEIFTKKSLKHDVRRFRKVMRKACYEFTPELVGEQIGLTPVCGIGARGNRLNQVIRDLVRSTKHELLICTPYFNPPKSVVRDINQLLQRGVKVTIVVGDKTANDFYIPPGEPFSTIGGLPYLYEHNLRSFARKHQKDIDSGQLNLMLWKDRDNSYHLKGLYSDHECGLITGSNINPRAWGLDLENGILIQDPHHLLKDELVNEHELILEHAQRIDHYRQLEKNSDYPLDVQKLLGRIRRLKAHVLIKKII